MTAPPPPGAGGPILALLRPFAPLATVALLAVSGTIAGRLLTGRLRFAGALERAVVATTLGLGALAQGALALAALGRLRRASVVLGLAALHLLGRSLWRQIPSELTAALRRLRPRWSRRPLLFGVAAGAAGLATLLLFALALYPPTAFDALLYHLPYVRAFAASGAAPFLPDLRNPIFPQLDELLMTLAYLFAGDLGAQSVSALATLLTAGLTYLWGRDAFADTPAAGALAAAAFLGNPIVVLLAGTAYVEPGLTLWVTASLYALHRFRRGAGGGWLLAAGACAGGAAAVKYLGLFFVAAGGLIVLAGCAPRRLSRRLSRRVADGLLFALAAAAVMAPWYGRILAATGNPVFPFFPGLFGATPWRPVFPDPNPVRAVLAAGDWWEAAKSWLLGAIHLPLDLLTGWTREGLGVPPSPAYLLAAPLFLLALLREPRIRRLLLLAAAYALVLVLLPRDVRYVTPVLPLASVALGGCLAVYLGDSGPARRAEAGARSGGGGRRPGAWIPVVVGTVLALPGIAYGVYRLVRQGPLPATPAGRDAYLMRELPVYPALRQLNRTLGNGYTLYAFHAEHMVYYADGRFLGDWNGLAGFGRMPPMAGDPEALYRSLRRLGADHLLVPNSPEITVATAAPAFRRRFHQVYRDAATRVFRLNGPPPPPAGPRPDRGAMRDRTSAGLAGLGGFGAAGAAGAAAARAGPRASLRLSSISAASRRGSHRRS